LRSYRSKLDIVADILSVVSQNAMKTQIMYQANLSYKVLQKYLRNMTTASLINFDTEEQCYMLTDKGKEFLETYKEYSKSNRRLEKRLKEINGTKKVLEELCSIKTSCL
jgi:predicted transcriptional regulator